MDISCSGTQLLNYCWAFACFFNWSVIYCEVLNMSFSFRNGVLSREEEEHQHHPPSPQVHVAHEGNHHCGPWINHSHPSSVNTTAPAPRRCCHDQVPQPQCFREFAYATPQPQHGASSHSAGGSWEYRPNIYSGFEARHQEPSSEL